MRRHHAHHPSRFQPRHRLGGIPRTTMESRVSHRDVRGLADREWLLATHRAGRVTLAATAAVDPLRTLMTAPRRRRRPVHRAGRGLSQIGGIEAFGEPLVDGGGAREGSFVPTLLLPQAGQTRGATQFPSLRILPPGDGKALLDGRPAPAVCDRCHPGSIRPVLTSHVRCPTPGLHATVPFPCFPADTHPGCGTVQVGACPGAAQK